MRFMLRGWFYYARSPLSPLLLHFTLSALIIVAIFRFVPAIFEGDVETARNFLGTISACLSTILALCISIIMVALQFTATKYTHRVLDFYIRFPYNASLLTFYLVAIVHSIYLMSRIRDPIHASLVYALNRGMSADLFLVVCCFITLMIYMYAVVQLIKPGTILRGIEREFRLADHEHHWEEALSRVEQICDLAKKAVLEMDSVTGVACVRSIAQTIRSKGHPGIGQDPVLSYHRALVEELSGIAMIAGRERDQGTCAEVLDVLRDIGLGYLNHGAAKAARYIVEAYASIVSNALIGQQQFSMIEKTVQHLYAIGLTAVSGGISVRKRRSFVLHVFRTLNHLGRLVLDREVGGAAYVARGLLSDAFGDLLSPLIESPNGTNRLRTILLFEYMKLARLLMQTAQMQNIIQITTWLRKEIIAARRQGRSIEPYAVLYMMLASTALYLERTDIVTVIVRSLGNVLEPDPLVLQQMIQRRAYIRSFYDEHEPAIFLVAIDRLWRAYRHFSLKKVEREPIDEAKAVSQSILSVNEWRGLFDGQLGREWIDDPSTAALSTPSASSQAPQPPSDRA